MALAVGKREQFHHGDLRASALRLARHTIDKEGVENLSLRGLAAELGVNHRALYRHFHDKQDLVLRLACTELDHLVDQMQIRFPEVPPALHARQLLEVYVRFGLEHRQLYGLIFNQPLHGNLQHGSPLAGPLNRLIDLAARAFQVQSSLNEPIRDRVVRAWGLAHGLILLFQSGALRAGKPSQVRDYIVNAALR